ncbi:leukosialin [Hyaena hyaena]|uniref:leukosialin n=1 Tax=Hyaena hyaena TaxID=95912 RepID=UPI00192499E7|nr:leukosialin [Hyaena hyaena]
MILLLLLFGGIWTQGMNSELGNTTLKMSASRESSLSLVPTVSGASGLRVVTPNPATAGVPEESGGTGHQISSPSLASYSANEVVLPEASTAASGDLHGPEPSVSGEVATNKSSNLEMNAKSPKDTLELRMETNGTMVTGSLEESVVTSSPPTAMATGSLETSDVTRGPSAAMTTGSLENSDVAGVTPLTISTGFLATPKGPSVSPISRVEISPISTPEAFTNTSSGDPPLGSGTNNTMLLAVFVALGVVVFLVILLMLWRRRQKRKTGALVLSRGGKRNGVVDAWAGPAQVSDEEALTAGAGGAGGGKGTGVSVGEGSGRQPALTTFFDRRKSQRGSLELEDLRQAPILKEEEEPLVGSKDEAVEAPAPASEGPEAGDVEAPQCS